MIGRFNCPRANVWSPLCFLRRGFLSPCIINTSAPPSLTSHLRHRRNLQDRRHVLVLGLITLSTDPRRTLDDTRLACIPCHVSSVLNSSEQITMHNTVYQALLL